MPTPNYMPMDDTSPTKPQKPRHPLDEEPQKPVQGSNMAAIFAALAQYIQSQPQQQQQKLELARDIGTGVTTSPHDMLYGRDNPSAFYNPNHDAYWAQMFGGRK